MRIIDWSSDVCSSDLHHRHWLRPDNATIFAVGDTTLAELTPLLEAQFGDWRPPAGAKPAKLFRMNRMARPARIVVIDRPGPQSLILAGQTLGVEGTDDPLTLITANEVLGGSFRSEEHTSELQSLMRHSY